MNRDATRPPSGQPVLTTPRLRLRPFTPADAPDVQRLAGERDVADTTLLVPHPYLDGMAEAWIATHQSGWDTRTTVTFAVVAANGGLRGAVGLALTPAHQRADLGYWVGRPWWGQGIATEAARAALAFAFDVLGVHRVQASHFVRNPASGRVLEKLGMRFEGVQREHFLRNGRFEDAARFGLLRREWQARGP